MLPDVDHLYFGNLFADLEQYRSGRFHGLALYPKSDRDIAHDIRNPLPFVDGSIAGFQSQDVFEHIGYDDVAGVLDEVYRCMKPGGFFRLSLPDYNSPLLRGRSAYDENGDILCDLSMGGRVAADFSTGRQVTFLPGGDAHVWFPTYASVLALIVRSQIRKCDRIDFRHAWTSRKDFVCEDIAHPFMGVTRAPPRDMRAGGAPVSMIVDFTK